MENTESNESLQKEEEEEANQFILPNGQNIRDLSLQEILLLPPDWIPVAPRGRPRKGTVEEYLGKKNVYKMLKTSQYRESSKTPNKAKPIQTNSAVISRLKHTRYRESWCNDPTYILVTSVHKRSCARLVSNSVQSTSHHHITNLSSWLHTNEIPMNFISVETTLNTNTQNKLSVPPFSSVTCSSGSIQLNTCGPISCIQPIVVSTQATREDWLLIGMCRIGWPSLTDPANIDYEYRQNENYFGDIFDAQERYWTLSNTDMFASDFIRPINHCHYRHSNLLQVWHKSQTSTWTLSYLVGLQDSGQIVSIHPLEKKSQTDKERIVALVQGNGEVAILSLPLITYENVNSIDSVVIPAESLLLSTLSTSAMRSAHEDYSLWITAFAWFPDSLTRCVTGMSDGSVWIWDTSSGPTTVNNSSDGIHYQSPTAKVLLKLVDASGVDVRVSAIAAVSSLEFCPYPLHTGDSISDNLLAVGSLDGVIRLWQLPPSNAPVTANVSLSYAQPTLLMSFNLGTNIQKLQWDATGHGLFYTCSDTSELHWLRLWSTITTKRTYVLSSQQVQKATTGNFVVPNGRTLTATVISNAFGGQRSSNSNDNPHNYYATDGIPYVYTASSDGCIRGGFLPTMLISKDPSEDGFVYMQVTNATYDAEQEQGKLSLNFGFNLPLQKMRRFGEDHGNTLIDVNMDVDDNGLNGEERDLEEDYDDEDDDFDLKTKKKKPPKKGSKAATKSKLVNDSATKGVRDIWYDSRVMIPVVTTLPPTQRDGEHSVIGGLQCGIVFVLPPHSVVDFYNIQPSENRDVRKNEPPTLSAKRMGRPARNVTNTSKRKRRALVDSDSEELSSLGEEEGEDEEFDEED